MPWARLELARGYSPRWILSPMRLPIPPPGLTFSVEKVSKKTFHNLAYCISTKHKCLFSCHIPWRNQ